MKRKSDIRTLFLTALLLSAVAMHASPEYVTPAEGVLDAVTWSPGLSSVSLFYYNNADLDRTVSAPVTLSRNGEVIAAIFPKDTARISVNYADDSNQYGPGAVPVGFADIAFTFFSNAADSPATLPGDYTMCIPRGLIYHNGEMEPETTLSWTIVAAAEPIYRMAPPAGDVTDLSRITVTFPEGYEVTTNEEPTYTVVEGVKTLFMPFELKPVHGGNITYYPRVSAQANVVTLDFDDVLPPRLYRLVIRRDAIRFFTDGATHSLEEVDALYLLQGDLVGLWNLDIDPPQGVYATPRMHSTGCSAVLEALFTFHIPDHWSIFTPGAWLVSDDALIDPVQLRMTADTDADGKPLICVNRMDYSGAKPIAVPLTLPPGRYHLELREGAFNSGTTVNPPLTFSYQYFDPLPCSVSPVPGSIVESLSEFWFDFGSASVELASPCTATVTNGVYTYPCLLEKRSDGRILASVSGGPATTPGLWHFTLPAGMLTADGAETPLYAAWHIRPDAKPMGIPLPSPDPGSVLDAIPTFTIPASDANAFTPMVCGLYLSATSEHSEQLAVPYLPVLDSASGCIRLTPMREQGTVAMLPPGRYTLRVPAGLWSTPRGVSPALVYTYTFEYPPLSEFSISPAPDVDLDHFFYFTIPLAADEDLVEVDSSLPVILEGPFEHPDMEPIDIARFRAETVDNSRAVELNNVLGYDVVSYFPDGYYVLHLPKRLYTTTLGYLPATDLTYHIVGGHTGIGTLPAEEPDGEACDAAAPLCTLDGKLLLREARAADLRRTAPGIYLHGRRKIVITR